jgi:hypothetical protein
MHDIADSHDRLISIDEHRSRGARPGESSLEVAY